MPVTDHQGLRHLALAGRQRMLLLLLLQLASQPQPHLQHLVAIQRRESRQILEVRKPVAIQRQEAVADQEEAVV